MNKKTVKNLELAKETVRNLLQDNLGRVVGGDPNSGTSAVWETCQQNELNPEHSSPCGLIALAGNTFPAIRPPSLPPPPTPN